MSDSRKRAAGRAPEKKPAERAARRWTQPVAVLLHCAMLAAASASAQDLSVFISVDMEGTVGAVTDDQLDPGSFEYERFRRFMTEETNAAIAAVKAAGATRVIVADTHGNGENLLIEDLAEDVLIVRSWPRPLGMAQGVEQGDIDAAIFLGYHAPAGSREGVLAHTWSGSAIRAVYLNEQLMSEGDINAALVGHFGVPVVMVSGDETAVEELRAFVGDIEGAVVKWSYGHHSALTLTPKAAYKLIGEKVRAAMERLDSFEPVRMEGPLTVDFVFVYSGMAEYMAFVPGAERVDSHTVRFVTDDIVEVQELLYLTSRM